jgi:hypothetical protein
LVDTGSAIVALEIKAGALGRPSIPRSAPSFIEAYQPRQFLIVSADRFETGRIGSTEISWITLDEVASTAKQFVA